MTFDCVEREYVIVAAGQADKRPRRDKCDDIVRLEPRQVAWDGIRHLHTAVAVISRTRRTDPLASTPLMRGSRAAAYWAVVPPDESEKENAVAVDLEGRLRAFEPIDRSADVHGFQSLQRLAEQHRMHRDIDRPIKRFLRQIAFAAFTVADLFDADGKITAMCGLPRHMAPIDRR